MARDGNDLPRPSRGGRKTIFKTPPKANFTIVPNELARDKHLSNEARGVLLWILSLPENWEFTKDSFMRENGIGRHRLDNVILQFEAAGYCRRVQRRLPERQDRPVGVSLQHHASQV